VRVIFPSLGALSLLSAAGHPVNCLIKASAVETIRADNLKVTGSNPAPATECILRAPPGEAPFCFQAVDNFDENP
jgi:hypothetical protein